MADTSLPLATDPQPIDHVALRGAAGDVALVLKSGPLDYAELERRVGRLAGWLAAQGYERGARVASWAGKGELTCLLPLAAPRAGLVHVPINPALKRLQVAHILADCDAAMIIGTAARLATLESGDGGECRRLSEAECLAEAAAATPLPPSAAAPRDLAAILYTSGSTGRPKGVMLSHANLWLGAESVSSYLALAPADRVLAVLPLAFDYGQNQLFSTWHAGAVVVPLDYLSARDVIKAVARDRITTLAGVPPLWWQLVDAEWPPDIAALLRRLTNSGGALTEPLVRRLRTTFPAAQVFAMYGLTEAFRSTYLDPALIDAHPTAIGRAIPHAEILVVDEAGRAAEEGELVHAGPLVAQGYWNDPARTAERFRPAPAGSRYGGTAVWSGDRVRRDGGGLLHFVGRRDAMIKTAGNRVSPHEVEEAAVSSGLAAEAVALGVPDERLGQAIHLIVRGSGDTAGLSRKLLEILPNFMQPRNIEWRDRLPTGPNGKVDRAALAREAAA